MYDPNADIIGVVVMQRIVSQTAETGTVIGDIG